MCPEPFWGQSWLAAWFVNETVFLLDGVGVWFVELGS